MIGKLSKVEYTDAINEMFDHLFEYCYKQTDQNLKSELAHSQRLYASMNLLGDMFKRIDDHNHRYIMGHQLMDAFHKLDGISSKDAALLLHYAVKTGVAETEGTTQEWLL